MQLEVHWESSKKKEVKLRAQWPPQQQKQKEQKQNKTQTQTQTHRQTDTQHTSSSKQAVDKIIKIIKNSLFFSLGLSLITINLAELKLS